MKRFAAPVFLSSSSPIAKSGFIRAGRTTSFPHPFAVSPTRASEAKPQTTSRTGTHDQMPQVGVSKWEG